MNRLKDFDELRNVAIQKSKQSGALKLVLACAEHPYGLKALREAAQKLDVDLRLQDAPLFKKRIEILEHLAGARGNSGVFNVMKARLVPK